MSLFCFLWLPLFYLFWRSVTRRETGSGGVWALVLGSIAAVGQFFLGNLIEPGGFGLSRWISACVDIVALPAVLPLLVYSILLTCRILRGAPDASGFVLLWLVPTAALRAVSWSAGRDPLLLVLVPLLWTAIALGMTFFMGFMPCFRWYETFFMTFCAAVLPFIAATSWWAFYSQRFLMGSVLFAVSAVPALISFIVSRVAHKTG